MKIPLIVLKHSMPKYTLKINPRARGCISKERENADFT